MMKRSIGIIAVIVSLSVNANSASIVFTPALKSAGFQIGLVVPKEYNGPGFGCGAQVNYELISWLYLYPSFEFWYAGEKRPEDHVVTEYTINADAKFILPVKNKDVPLSIYAATGFAFVIQPNYWSTDPFDKNHTDIGPGIDFLVGFDFLYTKVSPFLQFKYRAGVPYYHVFKFVGGLNFNL